MALKEPAPPSGHHASRRHPGARKWLYRIAAGLLLAGIVALGALYVAAPWLGRHFNRFFEDLIGATLNVPVVIESVQTSPFSQLTLTRLQSVSATESGRIDFAAREISFYYDPVELLAGRLEKLVLTGPRIFLNLDADLEGIARIPDVPPPPGLTFREPVSRPARGDAYLPFSIAETTIQSGEVALGFEGRTLELKNLRLSLFELGRAQGQSFQLTAEAFGARIVARGALDLTLDDGRVLPRYAFRDASVRVEGLELRKCVDWLRHAELPAEDAGSGSATGSATAALLALLETTAGVATLEGSLDGIWPERAELDLSTLTSDVSAGQGASLGVSSGQAKMRLRVTALGRFDELSFDLTAQATGRLHSERSQTDGTATLAARGQYVRTGGGTLRLDVLEADFGDAGRIEVRGEIASLEDISPPLVDLTVDAHALDAERLRELSLVRLPSGAPLTIAGNVDVKLQARGPLSRPRLDGTMTLPLLVGASDGRAAGSRAVVTAQLEGLEVEPDAPGGRLDSLRLSCDSIDLAAALSCLPRLSSFERHGVTVSGPPLSAVVQATGVEWSPGGVSGAVRASAIASDLHVTSEDFWLEATAVSARATLATRLGRLGAELPLEVAVDLALDEVLVGDVHAALKGEGSELRARGAWTAGEDVIEKLAFEELTVTTPLSGHARGSGRLERDDERRPRADLRLHLTDVPTSRAFRTLVREPFKNAMPLMQTIALNGESTIDLEIAGPLGALRSSGRWNLSGGVFKVGAFALEGIQLDLPFASRVRGGVRRPPAPDRGRLRIDRIASPALTTGGLDVPLTHDDGTYTLLEPVALSLFGGRLDVRSLSFAPAAGREPALEAAGRIEGVDLGALTKAYGWIPIDGRLDAAFQPLRYDGGRIEWKGTIDVKAFGGRVHWSDFTIRNLFQPYSSFELREGAIEDIRLRELETTFNFGLISGVARGRVQDLQIVGGELAGFRVDFETVPVAGVPQFVNRRAVRSIRRVLEGALGEIEETLFSRFRYDRFGFTSALNDGTFKLRGRYVEGGHEYIMRSRWYQFPRISIINARPGQAYDWDVIVESLREIYESAGETPAEE